jgi:hypothetical protein
MYPVPAGTHTFYAVARNYVETDGNGIASIYGSLTVEFYPDLAGNAFAKHAGISETNINVHGGPVPVGHINVYAPVEGLALVHFDGTVISDVGDRIVLAASNAQNWSPNDGNVGLEAANADQNRNSFSHSRVYEVPAGSHDFYAVAQNYVETAGNGIASIYASLTVEFFPISGSDVLSYSDKIPSDYTLDQNYPNPFNPNTTIRYALPKSGMVSLTIYNINGHQVKTIVQEVQQAGSYSYDFNAEGLASGIYYYQLKVDGSVRDIKKMVLAR